MVGPDSIISDDSVVPDGIHRRDDCRTQGGRGTEIYGPEGLHAFVHDFLTGPVVRDDRSIVPALVLPQLFLGLENREIELSNEGLVIPG